jgi:hypothetical protein
MAEREGGQWNVAVKSNSVQLERVSESGEHLYDDLLEPDEARQLGELLIKHAGKVSESEKSDESDEDDEDDESDDDQDSDESEQSDDEQSKDNRTAD